MSRARAGVRRWESDSLRLVIQVWVGTRLLFATLVVWLAIVNRRSWTAVVAQWDVLHFTTIARDGYADRLEVAFFPGLPLLMRAGEIVGLPHLVTGVLVAAVGSLAAALALYRLGGPWAAVAWLLAPTGVFTAVPYTESPFMAAAFWAWERATSRHWGQAAMLAAVACTFRVSGLFLLGALAVLALTQKPRRGSSRGKALAWLLLPTAVIVAYAVYLFWLTGTWTAWYTAQAAGWSRGFHWPWEALAHTWDAVQQGRFPQHPEWVWLFRAELVSMAIGVVVTVVCLVRRRIAEAFWVGIQVVAFAFSYWFMSVNRAVLLWFPLWTSLGEFIESRPRSAGWVVTAWVAGIVALAVQGVWAWLFFTGRWAS